MRDKQLYNKGRRVKICYEDGNSSVITTRLSVPKCAENFMRRDGVRALVFLDRNVTRDARGNYHVLRRIYSLSDAFMERYDLGCRYRYTEHIITPFEWKFWGAGGYGTPHDAGIPDCVISDGGFGAFFRGKYA